MCHTGRGAVIDAVRAGLGLAERDVRHTRSVPRDYGSVSGGSSPVTLERLPAEGSASPGDYGVLVTMVPARRSRPRL